MSESNIHPAALEENKRMALIEERIRNPVLITDYEGLITWCNQAFTSLMGYTPDEVMGSKLGHFLLGPKTDSATVERLNAALAEKKNFDGEIYYYSKSGKARWFTLATSPILDDVGNFIGFIAIHTDITERKYAESELRAAKEALEMANHQLENANNQLEEALARASQMASEAALANQIKDEFLTHISQEIRSPLSEIINHLHKFADSQLSSEQQERVKCAQTHTEALDHVIKNFLQFHEIESGKLKIEQKSFELQRCLEEVLKGRQIHCSIHELMPRVFMGDEKRLRQIFSALFNNAMRLGEKEEGFFEASSKPLENNFHEIHFQTKVPNREISKENFNALLQGFGSVSISSKQSLLGFAITKRLAELMGGTLWIESEINKGSIFHFTVTLEAQS